MLQRVRFGPVSLEPLSDGGYDGRTRLGNGDSRYGKIAR